MADKKSFDKTHRKHSESIFSVIHNNNPQLLVLFILPHNIVFFNRIRERIKKAVLLQPFFELKFIDHNQVIK